jgi:hypothetical protein
MGAGPGGMAGILLLRLRQGRFMNTPNWLLLQAKPRQELPALASLERQKGECYCPQIQNAKLNCGKPVQVA